MRITDNLIHLLILLPKNPSISFKMKKAGQLKVIRHFWWSY